MLRRMSRGVVVGAVDDPSERAADRAADAVVGMTSAPVDHCSSPLCGHGSGPGRCPTCAAEEQRDRLRREPVASPGTVPSTAPPVVATALGGPGRPLDAASRIFFEPRLGLNLGAVRVHDDALAALSAQAVGARAYAFGDRIAFAPGEYAPHTSAGRWLLAHELAHVVQAASGAAPTVRRDLATPPPVPAAPAQPDLTPAQIREAINFNSQFYDEANTRLIQRLLGGPVTGRWTAGNIAAIAATQEEYGLKKDGKVGPDTFQFLNQEQIAEGVDTNDANCLTAFRAVVFPLVDASATAGPSGTTHIEGHHHVEARFSPRCDCSQFEYRQFVAGVATASLGPNTRDISNGFSLIPGGSLPIAEVEDGITTCTSAVNYGHRNDIGHGPGGTICPENRYMDDAGTIDQHNGCRYSADDHPDITVTGLPTGTTVLLEVDFRGEIRRSGRVIETRRWTTVDTSVTTP